MARSWSAPRRKRLAAAVTLLTAAGVTAAPAMPAAAATPTVVVIQFDDGVADQYPALAALNAHAMHATFFVNSGPITAGDPGHLSWAQVQDLYAAGNEIAGHTVDHANIKKLKTADARHQVCDDRVALFQHGFQPTSFAYPFGSFDSGSKAVVQACGYNSGRGVSGVDERRVFAETIPPADAYATRTPANVKSADTPETIESYVTGAEQHGGGMVQIVIHHICDRCDAYSITQANFEALLDWLTGHGSIVQTTAQVIGGAVQPPVPA
ncbi:MAG: polysaccharide deacetylase family protein [Mycobacteriales bacterium]